MDELDDAFDFVDSSQSVDDLYPLSASQEYVYVVLAQAVKQHIVAHEIPKFFPCKAINPIVIKRKWTGSTYKEITYSLMPGYIFLFSNERMEPRKVRTLDGVLKVLQYDDGAYALTAEDERLARWLALYDGTIGVSQAVRAGDRIQVVQGPLKDNIGRVTKVDKRRQRAKVEFQFNDTVFSAWMDFDWVETET